MNINKIKGKKYSYTSILVIALGLIIGLVTKKDLPFYFVEILWALGGILIHLIFYMLFNFGQNKYSFINFLGMLAFCLVTTLSPMFFEHYNLSNYTLIIKLIFLPLGFTLTVWGWKPQITKKNTV